MSAKSSFILSSFTARALKRIRLKKIAEPSAVLPALFVYRPSKPASQPRAIKHLAAPLRQIPVTSLPEHHCRTFDIFCSRVIYAASLQPANIMQTFPSAHPTPDWSTWVTNVLL